MQIVCAVFYFVTLLSSITKNGILSWAVHEFIELGAALGFLLGVVVGAITLHRTLQRNQIVEDQLKTAFCIFLDRVDHRLKERALTQAE